MEQQLALNDIYDIPYKNIGGDMDILRVIVLPNTCNIVNMYPLTLSHDDYDGYSYKLIK